MLPCCLLPVAKATQWQHQGVSPIGLVRLTPLQAKVGAGLREGRAQSLIAKEHGISRPTVSKIARKLVSEGFLTQETTIKPYLYGNGPRAKELDQIAVSEVLTHSAKNGVATYGTSVKPVSKATRQVNGARVHHCKVRWLVNKIGDRERLVFKDGNVVYELPFLDDKPYLNRRNVSRTKGVLSTPVGKVSVELEETPNQVRLYAHIPEEDLPEDMITNGEWKDRCEAKAQEIGNFVQKWGHWQLGLMELCPDWVPHFAVHDPRILRDELRNYTSQNAKGDVWTSGSEGRAELETSRPEYVSVMVDMPGKLYELKMQVSQMLEVLEMLSAGQVRMAEIEAMRLERDIAANGGAIK